MGEEDQVMGEHPFLEICGIGTKHPGQLYLEQLQIRFL